ncbi:MAG: DUF420 domain-containing protein [Deltaproteobacteria bacterium]|nr:DUF420 domain-containing protein [Deltaproteobacteria bacterium]
MHESLANSLAALNSILNTISAILLVLGFRAIKQKKKKLHAGLMISAFSVSVLFLISYLIRYYLTGHHSYPGEGFVKTLYLGILLSHTILAVLVPFLAIISLYFAIKKNFLKHKKIAKVTFPIWLYVNVTGVVIYLMLYRFVS